MADRTCNLFVIPARDVPIAAIIRSGPAGWCQLIKWDTRHDKFEDGAWFKGRIFAERCDLSSDGRLFVYSCHSSSHSPGGTDAWTAVSKLPWLFAFGLWSHDDADGGGGRFLDNRQLRLHTPTKPHPQHRPVGFQVVDGGEAEIAQHASSDEIEGADWSGRDYHGAVIFCRDGKLYRRVGRKNPENMELMDFNNRVPKPEPTPSWARNPAD